MAKASTGSPGNRRKRQNSARSDIFDFSGMNILFNSALVVHIVSQPGSKSYLDEGIRVVKSSNCPLEAR
ncbi:hypothetical protein T4D_16086 [Trichinella pseudospiralis]|uniref:Uncharacterized protein n=1 Tax=Trichinella pseudospiralis TaxID=6337 RepID=A0A0V1G0D6_TRIPS|nr:hypothetical protein T4D_16086 [Trichinella pseudospiralis]